MIQLQQVTLQLGSKILLDEADLMIPAQQKIGIVGANGAGKTSLFNLIQGALQAEHGEVQILKQKTLAHIRQDMPNAEISAVDYALQGDAELSALYKNLDIAEKNEDGMAIANLHSRLAEIDGYAAPSQAAKVLLGLGFQQDELSSPVNSFSGGWRMRLNLAQVLLARADILLLDEPTNHLDLEGIVWLENWLQNEKSTVLIISHDREFLDRVATQIAYLNDRKLTLYTGNYSAFEKEYAQQLVLQKATYQKQQKHREHLQKFVERFRYKASKAKQAQSRLKMLERMATVEAIQDRNPFSFSFRDTSPGGRPMLKFRDTSVGYDEHIVLKHINFSISDGEHIGLLGLNGAGKSTFIKLLAGELTPCDGITDGNQKLKIGYFAQHQLEQLDQTATPLQHLLCLDAKIGESEARRFLGGFNFQGDRVFEPIRIFSGGEKARLALALIIWNKPNLLLLDEPTNHLDMEMREALNLALQNYTGALVLVSHDRYLLKSLVDEFWLVANGEAQPFAGDLQDYRDWLPEQQAGSAKDSATKGKASKQTSQSRNKLKKQIDHLERKLANKEGELQLVEEELADPKLYQIDDKDKLHRLMKKQQDIQQQSTEIEEKLLELMESV